MAEIKVGEEQFLLDRKYKCAICDKTFTTKSVRTGRARFIGSDEDLRPRYMGIDTLKYDVILCPYCGYAAVQREFDSMTDKQRILLKSEIMTRYAGSETYTNGCYDYETAINRYNRALLVSMVKPSKLSESAYLCLKLSWIYRGAIEELEKIMEERQLSEAEQEKLEEYRMNEKLYYQEAFSGFEDAISTEYPPICGMDETTMNVLMSAMAKRLERYDESLNFGMRVLSSYSASAKVKDKERAIIDEVRKLKKAHTEDNNGD